MFALDLFDNEHERRLVEGAVDQLEQRRIDDLAMKMDDLVARAKNPAYKKNPAALAALMKEFQKCKAERDSYYHVREAGIPGSVPADKIPGKEDLLKGKGRSYYEGTEEEEEWYDANGRPNPRGAYDAGGHYYADREEDMDAGYDAYKERGYTEESGIPGNVPADKIPGKEDLLKGKGRSYYETQDQKKSSKKISEGRMAELDAMRQDLERMNDRQFFTAYGISKAAFQQKYRTLLKPANIKEHGGGIGPKQRWQDLMQENKLSVGDPVVVTGPNEFEGKTGEIAELSPSGKFVVVDLYNHGQHSMHLSDVEYNQYAAEQEDEDDWYDDGAEDTLEETNNPKLDALIKNIQARMKKDDYKRPEIMKQVAQMVAQADPTVQDAMATAQQLVQQYGQSPAPAQTHIGGMEISPPKKLKPGETHQGINAYNQALGQAPIYKTNEGWSDAMVARRTGRPRTPYSVYIKGKKWKDFENDDHAEAVANKLKAKFKADGRDPETITIAPTDYNKMSEGTDQVKKVFKDKFGKPVGEIGIDPESSPGNGEWYVHHYTTGYSVVGFDSAAEAKRELLYVHKHPDAVEGHPSTKEQDVAEAGSPAQQAAIAIAKKKEQGVEEAIVASGPSQPLDDRAVRKLVWDTMKINADTGEQAIQRALSVLAKKPQSRMVQDLQDKFQNLSDRLSQGLVETTDVKSGMAKIYNKLAPKIERYRDSFLAGQLYDELENYAELHGAESEFKRMMNGARNRAHMEYDTNPGGFHNWFWFLPFADEQLDEFAPSPEREDDEVPDQILKLANRWWNATDDQPRITNVLRSLGWSIAQVESEDDAVQMQHDDGTTYFISADDFDPEVFEEKTRLDPKCWKGKKIGTPKTKVKGGVRVNNCVPAESINEEQDTSGVERAILNRIMVAHTDLLMKFGPEKVMQAAEEVAYNVGDVDEIGTSDVSAYVHQVKQILGAA